MSVFFILNAHFVEKTASVNHLIVQWTFFKKCNEVGYTNQKGSLDLSLDNYFDQIDSIPSELISQIGLTENNSSC